MVKSTCLEDDDINPLSYYGFSKFESEKIALSLASAVVIRTSLVFGYANNLSRNNFPLWLINELHQNKELTITADQFRSPTYVYDLANAIPNLIESYFNGILHLGGSERIGVYEFAKAISAVFDLNPGLMSPVNTDNSNSTSQRPKSSALDISKAINNIDYAPRLLSHSLNEMKEMMN